MTDSEYQDLIAFLGRKFNEVDGGFESVDARLLETRRHFEVVAEGLRADIRQVAEGHQLPVGGQTRILVGTRCAHPCNGSEDGWSASWAPVFVERGAASVLSLDG